MTTLQLSVQTNYLALLHVFEIGSYHAASVSIQEQLFSGSRDVTKKSGEFSEWRVGYNQSTRGHIPEDWNLHQCRRDNPTIPVNQMFAGRPLQLLLTANSWKLNQVSGVGKMLWVWSNIVRGFGVCFFSNVSQCVNSAGMYGAVTVLCANLCRMWWNVARYCVC